MTSDGDDEARAPVFIGLDCSTQSITAVVTDARGVVLHERVLRFDDEFPQYGTTNGVRHDANDSTVVLVPSLMLADALDRIFEVLTADARSVDAFDMSAVLCISGSAQQHTSAFWSSDFSLRRCLDKAKATEPLASVLERAGAFAQECGPSWMDSSTIETCAALESVVGGADVMARISGSRAYPRFTGTQIAKIITQDRAFIHRTGRIALASTLLASLLVGDYVSMDASDASGMNLLDLKSRKWSPLLASAIVGADETVERRLYDILGEDVVNSHECVGSVHPYYQQKYGLSPSCKVVSFSGDNPCTIAGIGLSEPGDVAVSLGTSTTVMALVEPLDTACAKLEGHFFINPIDPDTLMAMTCFKNGALAREEVRDMTKVSSWTEFESRLLETSPGNDGHVGFFFRDPEITPTTARSGFVLFDANDEIVNPKDASLPAATVIRAVVESQCLSMRLHSERLGVRDIRRLIATGGGAASFGLLQVLADVFGVPVLRLTSTSNSAALGAAFRARHGILCATSVSGFVSFPSDNALELVEIAEPRVNYTSMYTSIMPRFAQLEAQVAHMLN